MKPTSRATTPGHRPRPDRSTTRRTRRRLPSRPAGTEPEVPRPQPYLVPPPPDVVGRESDRRRRRGWRWPALVAAGVVVLLVECVFLIRSFESGDDGQGGRKMVAPLVAPALLPPQGTLVTSTVRADGTVAVTQWLQSTDGLDQVTLSAPTVGASDPARATGLRLVDTDGTVLADGITVTDRPKRVRFDFPTRLIRATYVLDGVADRSDTVSDRLLVNALSLRMEGADPGPTIVEVTAPVEGVVRNLACADARSPVTLVRPCGAPIGDGWRVRLDPEDLTARVQAQVDAR